MGRFTDMRWTKCTLVLTAALCCHIAGAQVNGGQFAFEYLRMSNAPHVSALGGISVADPENDIAFAIQNPAMMRPGLHNELSLNYNSFYGGIGIMNLAYGYYHPKIQTAFFLGVQYLNYGTFTQTDQHGSQYGDFHANDYAITLGASRTYQNHWRYGADIKWAHSDLYNYTASAALVDIGINYYDTVNMIDIGAVAKNMGGMVKRYNPANVAEPLPFDLQLGISKRFKHVPLRVFATLHHLYEWDVRYDNPVDDVTTSILGTTDSGATKGNHFADKLFRHFIFGAELTLGSKLTLTGSYNYMLRKELALTTQPGIAGFAFGVSLNLTKFQIHYARTYYHIAGAYNEIGITMNLNKIVGGKKNWAAQYADWQ